MQVRLLLDAIQKSRSARSSIGSGRQPLTLARRVRFPHGSCRVERRFKLPRDRMETDREPLCWLMTLVLRCSTTFGQVVQQVDTRRSERRARTGLGVRLSPWSIDIQSRRQTTQVDQSPAGSHKPGSSGATPEPAIETLTISIGVSRPSTQTGKAIRSRAW